MKIILSAVVALLLIGCSDNHTTEKKEKVASKQVVQEKVVKQVIKPVEKEKIVETTVEKVKEKIVEKSAPIVEKKLTQKKSVTSVVVNADGKQIFQKCTACHGVNAEKKALNKSAVIQGWSSDKIMFAIKGYQNGTYGSSMKSVMKPQVAKLSRDDIKAVAKYISGL